jgi:uncharacterized membrane protein
MKKLMFFWNELTASFWFVPVMIMLFSVLMAIGFVYALTRSLLSLKRASERFFFVNSVDSARSILSTISGAMIGVAGTVFSVTLVALTLASSQLGPRLIKTLCMSGLTRLCWAHIFLLICTA